MDAEHLVKAFFESACGCNEVPDSEVIEYIAGVLADPDSVDNMEDVDELACSNSPAFEAIPKDRRLQSIIELVEKIQNLNTADPPAAPQTTINIAASVASASGKQHITANSASSKAADTSSQEDQASRCHINQMDIQTLAELCPEGTGRDYLAHLLQHEFAGNVQRAAEWLLECSDDIIELADAWRTAEQKAIEAAEEEARADEKARKALLERFHLQVVTEPAGAKKAGKGLAGSLGEMRRSNKEQQVPQVRYRDGQVVSKRGEKFVVETVGEEWDGGSKGKVYTKGKRGKGFV